MPTCSTGPWMCNADRLAVYMSLLQLPLTHSQTSHHQRWAPLLIKRNVYLPPDAGSKREGRFIRHLNEHLLSCGTSPEATSSFCVPTCFTAAHGRAWVADLFNVEMIVYIRWPVTRGRSSRRRCALFTSSNVTSIISRCTLGKPLAGFNDKLLPSTFTVNNTKQTVNARLHR